jgi:hypothetical protein
VGRGGVGVIGTRHRQHRALVLLLLPMAIACAELNADAPMPPAPTDDPQPVTAGMQAQVTARVDGEAETPCLWLIPAHGKPAGDGERLSVVWPSHYTIRTDPLRLVAPDGTEAARVNDIVVLAGGSSDDDPLIDPQCRVSESVFVVSEIESRNSS